MQLFIKISHQQIIIINLKFLKKISKETTLKKMEGTNDKLVTLIILGCGSRGTNYASYALIHPGKARIVGIADPCTLARKKFIQQYPTIDESKVFASWKQAMDSVEKLADCVVIALPDQEHRDAAIAATKQGLTIYI